MPQPTPFHRGFSFTDYQSTNPSGQTPGYRLDAELDAVAQTLTGVLGNLALIQRDDGKLKDGSVTVDAVSADLLQAIALRAPPGPQGNPGGKGDPGQPGADGKSAERPNFTFFLTSLAPGAQATCNVIGNYPNLELHIGIPKGDPAPAGAAVLADATYGDVAVSNGGTVFTVNKVMGGQTPAAAIHGHSIADVAGLQNQLTTLGDGLAAKLAASARGAANGVASLDGAGRMPFAQLPSNVPGIGVDGGMEVGSYLDFHNPTADGLDFKARIAVDASGNVVITGQAGSILSLNGATVSLTGHTHSIANVAGLQAALDGKQAAGSYATTAQLAGKADVLTAVVDFSSDASFSDANNGTYIRFLGGTPRTASFGNLTTGVAMILVNRSTANLTISCPGGYYKNGAAASATTNLTLAPGGKMTAFHEGGGSWTFDGTGF